MDEKGTYTDQNNHRLLISVRPGNICKLVGVSNTRMGFGRHRHQKHHRSIGWFGRFFRHHENWEQKKREWHMKGERQITKRLLDLGLTKGCTFKVVHGSERGPILVEVRGTRIALGHGLASKVLVEVLEEHE